MDIDLSTLTLVALLTTPGATVAAGLVTGLVGIFANLIPGVRGNEKKTAAVLSALLVVLLAVAAIMDGTFVLPGAIIALILAVVFAWYNITRMSMSIYDDFFAKPASLRAGDSPSED